MTKTDYFYMQRALDLAICAYGNVSPNPYVGAVLVKNDQIIGEGFHHKAGSAHAEVNAIQQARTQGFDTAGATIYVTLEPCCHFGKTPPCTDLLIQSNIKRVVIAMQDPNPLVQGQGIAQLKAAGMEVELGLLNTEAQQLNRIFIHNQCHKRPFVALKTALSLDGKCATVTGDSKWISNEQARLKTHELRQGFDAILIGSGTLKADNPQLTIRHPDFPRLNYAAKQLTRIILSTHPEAINFNAQLFTDNLAPTWLIIPKTSTWSAPTQLNQNIKILPCPDKNGEICIPALLDLLYQHKICSLFVEGGAGIYSAFWNAQMVDWLYLFQAPIIVGNSHAPSLWNKGGIQKMADKIELADLKITQIENNQLIEGKPIFPQP